MNLTEAEAASKWCPHSRQSDVGHWPYTTHGAYRCIASECMAWRWVPPEPYRPSPNMWHYLANKHRPSPQRQPRGFCGLAGKVGAA